MSRSSRGEITSPQGSRFIAQANQICEDIAMSRNEKFSLEYLLKGLVSILKDERATSIVAAEEFQGYRKSENRGPFLLELAKRKTRRGWSEDELLDLDNLVKSIYGYHKRPSVRLEDKMVLLSRPYICSQLGCTVKDNLEIDHIIPVKRGGTSKWHNLQWLCQKHNREKWTRIKYL